MRKYFLTLVVGVIFLSGCGLSSANKEPKELTNNLGEQKNVIFDVSVGYVGGVGEAPVLDASGGIKTFNNLPVYFDADRTNELKSKLPECYVGKPVLKVNADVELAKKQAVNNSLPTPETQDFYEVKILNYFKPIEVISSKPCL